MSIGEQYRMAREEKGLSIEEISEKTKINNRIIEAIENNTIQDNLSNVYAKSFLKKYAQFLGLNFEELIQGYQPEPSSKPPQQVLMMKPRKYSFNYKYILPLTAGLAAIFLSMLIFGYMNKANSRRPMEKQTGKKTLPLPQVLPQAKTAARSAAGELLVPKNEKLVLALAADREVWVKVVGDGKTLFEGVLKKNSQEKWTAEEGFMLWTGKAEGLRFILNNQNLPSPGKGVMKNIVIDREGLKVK